MLANVMGPSSYAVSCGQLSRLQADWFLLACGIIVTSAFCIDGIAIADQFIEKLHQLCNIPMIDISDMCVAIIECTVD
ncbi:unnamed protein product [Thelazia callipaeda]|uniref:Aa_trans domain-containing protein n=1 Tax=Thelazia callipaeda TaxID=103827 RepID=A0A0N5CSP6_THECL|nr:unnamed protein product [Thelazia callipaeda]